MNIILRIRDLLEQDSVNRITVPRDILLYLFLIQFLLLEICAFFFHGIWILIVVPIAILTIFYLRFYYRFWKRYYSPVTFWIQLALSGCLTGGLCFLLRTYVITGNVF
ncbi:MAG: hypothetical protein K6G29_08750 [Clostridiales bacterium]|nr:hypothetical protein [Clostridiales bacterium]